MISENELEGYERVVSDRLYDGTYIKRIVLKLVAEVRKMNKKYALLLEQGREDQEHAVDLQLEADWLAAQLARFDTCPNDMLHADVDCFLRCERHMYTKPCWRAFAKEAVKDASS